MQLTSQAISEIIPAPQVLPTITADFDQYVPVTWEGLAIDFVGAGVGSGSGRSTKLADKIMNIGAYFNNHPIGGQDLVNFQANTVNRFAYGGKAPPSFHSIAAGYNANSTGINRILDMAGSEEYDLLSMQGTAMNPLQLQYGPTGYIQMGLHLLSDSKAEDLQHDAYESQRNTANQQIQSYDDQIDKFNSQLQDAWPSIIDVSNHLYQVDPSQNMGIVTSQQAHQFYQNRVDRANGSQLTYPEIEGPLPTNTDSSPTNQQNQAINNKNLLLANTARASGQQPLFVKPQFAGDIQHTEADLTSSSINLYKKVDIPLYSDAYDQPEPSIEDRVSTALKTYGVATAATYYAPEVLGYELLKDLI